MKNLWTTIKQPFMPFLAIAGVIGSMTLFGALKDPEHFWAMTKGHYYNIFIAPVVLVLIHIIIEKKSKTRRNKRQ